MPKEEYTYAPLPMASYRIPGARNDEIAVIQGMNDPIPVWNLFWLSHPGLDSIPVSGEDWWRYYVPSPPLLRSVILDTNDNDELNYKLVSHPYDFAEWLRSQNPVTWRTFLACGKNHWYEGVIRRADEAGDRMSMGKAVVTFVNNRVKVRL